MTILHSMHLLTWRAPVRFGLGGGMRAIGKTTSPAGRGLFALRCAAAACVAYWLAVQAGASHPVWAPISALVVSQEAVAATFASVAGRTLGTLTGAVVALLAIWLGRAIGVSTMVQIAGAVALCAAIAAGRPHIRVALWTCPLLLVVPRSGLVSQVAVTRASEVVLGAIVGGAMAFLFRMVAMKPRTGSAGVLGRVLG